MADHLTVGWPRSFRHLPATSTVYSRSHPLPFLALLLFLRAPAETTTKPRRISRHFRLVTFLMFFGARPFLVSITALQTRPPLYLNILL